MSLPATAVPVAVLVLAWDDATPAVRALLEAIETTTPVLDSVVVLVPAEAGAPTQEEFLPLEPTPDLVPAAVNTDEQAEEAESTPPSESDLTPVLLAEPAELPLGPIQATEATSAQLLSPIPNSLPVPDLLVKGTVRVLRLSSFNLSELAALSSQALPLPIWVGSAVLPAAPYLGGQAALPAVAPSTPVEPARSLEAIALPLPSSSEFLDSSQVTALPLNQTVPSTSLAYLPGNSLPALDAEADLVPVLLSDLSSEETTPAAIGPAQAGWTEALASLRNPLPPEEPAFTPDYEDEAAYYADQAEVVPGEQPDELLALLPASQAAESPNLNFQVIQYARFAVPVALAQAPFAAIYAPAWPTWLAAQELRYRTRQPLVLHVAALAAGDEESVATATGWQAELQRQALQRADLILAETPALANRLRHDLGLPPDLVRTVPAANAQAVAMALRTAQLRPTANPS
jgi:hypothetical protein